MSAFGHKADQLEGRGSGQLLTMADIWPSVCYILKNASERGHAARQSVGWAGHTGSVG